MGNINVEYYVIITLLLLCCKEVAGDDLSVSTLPNNIDKAE